MRRSSAPLGLALALALGLPLAVTTAAGAVSTTTARTAATAPTVALLTGGGHPPRLGKARAGLRALLRDLD